MKARAISTESRGAPATPLQFLHEDDALTVTRIERLHLLGGGGRHLVHRQADHFRKARRFGIHDPLRREGQ